jgi:hypothetical protein
MYKARTKKIFTKTFSGIDTRPALWMMFVSPNSSYDSFDAMVYTNAESGKVLLTSITNRHLQVNNIFFTDYDLYIQKNARYYRSDDVGIYFKISNLKALLLSNGTHQTNYRYEVKIYDPLNVLVRNISETRDEFGELSNVASVSIFKIINTTNYIAGKYSVEIVAEDLFDSFTKNATGYFYLLSDSNVDRIWTRATKITSYDYDGETQDPCIIYDSGGKYWIAFSSLWYSWDYPGYGLFGYYMYGYSVITTINSTSPTTLWGRNNDARLSNDYSYAFAAQPSLIQDRNNRYILAYTYQGKSTGGDIWLSISNDCVEWNKSYTKITNDTFNDYHPSLIQDRNGVYWLAWVSNRGGNYDVWITNSSDAVNWTNNPVKLSSDTLQENSTRVLQSMDGRLIVSWISEKKVMYTVSSDNGNTWSIPATLFDGGTNIETHDIIQTSDGKFLLVFQDYNTTNKVNESDIFITNSSNLINWGEVKQVTTSHYEYLPRLMADKNGKLWLVWTSFRSGYGEIWLSYRDA